MNTGLENIAAFINAGEANQRLLLRKVIAPLVQAHYAVFEAASALLDQLEPTPSDFFANKPIPSIFAKPSSASDAMHQTPVSDAQAHDRGPQATPAPATAAAETPLGSTPQSPPACEPVKLQPCEAPTASLLHTVDPIRTHHCLPFEPLLVVDQIMPQRKPAYALQNAPNFGNSIFGRTEAIYQGLVEAAKNIAQQDVAATHDGRGVMLIKRENTFVLLSVIGQADLPNMEFAELHLALEAAAMFLSGLTVGVKPGPLHSEGAQAIKTGEPVIPAEVMDVLSRYGIPYKFVSDCFAGSAYQSKVTSGRAS